jgi:hypothetical protein
MAQSNPTRLSFGGYSIFVVERLPAAAARA